MDKKPRGGSRPGAGRPKSDDPPRTMRGFKFTDEEWETIQKQAAGRDLSARAYISWLVAQDKNQREQ